MESGTRIANCDALNCFAAREIVVPALVRSASLVETLDFRS